MNFPRRPDGRPAVWLAAAVTAVAVGLHFYFLFRAGGLWRDEVHLVNLAALGSLPALAHDSFPLLMPLLVRGWEILGIGKTDFGLRLLGLLVGLGLPAALWLAAWKIRRSPPLPGLALLALNGTVIVFGDSLRAHGLGALLILLTVFAAARFLEKPSWKRAGGWTVLAVLSVQTLFHNAIFIAAISAGAWAVCARRKDGRAALKVFLVGLAAAVSLLPYLPTFISLAAGAASLRTGVEPGRLHATVDDAFGFPLGQTVWLWLAFALALLLSGLGSFLPRAKIPFPVAPLKFIPPARWTKLLVFLAAAAGFLWFAAASAKHAWFFPALILCVVVFDWAERARSGPETDSPAANDLPLFAGVTVLAAVAGFAGFLRFAALPTESWYFIPLMALAAGGFEIGLPARGHGRAAVLGLSAVTAGLACVVIFADQRAVNWRFTNLDLLCPRLAAEAGPEDLIIVSPWYCGITFQRYFKGATPWETAPPIADHSLARYDLVHEQMQKPRVMQPLIARAEKTLRAGRRVWVVSVLGAPDAGPPPPDLPPPPLPTTGWTDRPYSETWILQVNRYMRNHGGEFTKVFETPEGETNFMENLQLYRVEGWRD